jgi:hypothetical protein
MLFILAFSVSRLLWQAVQLRLAASAVVTNALLAVKNSSEALTTIMNLTTGRLSRLSQQQAHHTELIRRLHIQLLALYDVNTSG